MHKAVVFDLDGTLVDSPLCFKTMKRELEIPENEYILEYLPRFPEGVRAEKYQKLESMELSAARAAKPYDGVLGLLKALARSDIRLGIFTRNCRVATEQVISSLNLTVDCVITREDAAPKPHPEGLIRFLTLWGLQPNELLYVGDSHFDVKCGKAAGVTTALFVDRPGRQPILNGVEKECDVVFSHYSEFLGVTGLIDRVHLVVNNVNFST